MPPSLGQLSCLRLSCTRLTEAHGRWGLLDCLLRLSPVVALPPEPPKNEDELKNHGPSFIPAQGANS